MSYKIKKLRLNNSNSGMTLIEAMTVMVIIGILVAIGAANYLNSAKKRALEASLQSNMKTLQVMLETYKVDWSEYPRYLSELDNAANDKKYNRSLANPYTSKSGPVGSNIWAIKLLYTTDASFASQKSLYTGRVGYQPIAANGGDPYDINNNIGKYYLLGYDGDSELILRNNTYYTVTSG